jgi:hypothetical protein
VTRARGSITSAVATLWRRGFTGILPFPFHERGAASGAIGGCGGQSPGSTTLIQPRRIA